MLNKFYNTINNYLFRYQFIRFIAVGSVSTVVDFGLLALFTEVFGLFYLTSATLSFVVANIVNFVLSKRWTFKNLNTNSMRQYVVFVSIGAIGLLINNGILYMGVEMFGVHYIVGKIVATAVVMFWNFFLNKYVTFVNRDFANKRIRVCFFNSGFPPSKGGVATFSYEWAMETAKHENISETKVIAFGNPKPRFEKLSHNIHVKAFSTRKFVPVGVISVLYVIRNFYYDVFHATNLFPIGFWVVFWSKLFRRKSVVTFHGTDACTTRGSRITRILKKWTIDNADYALSVSESTREKSKIALGYNASVRVMYAGIPINTVSVESVLTKSNTIRNLLGIDKEDFVCICVNQLVKRKGVEYIIRAMQKIDDENVKLIIVGSGPEKQRLVKMIQDASLDKRVFMLGRVPCVVPYYKCSNVCILSSYEDVDDGNYEGLGLVLLEAQKMGLPVIGTDSGGIPEAIEDGKSGFVVPEKDVDAIVSKILLLRNNTSLYSSMSNRAIEFVEEKFNPGKNIDKYVKMLLT